jgi:hypothetical protein
MSRWDDQKPTGKKVYQTSMRMMLTIVGSAFVAGILVGFNFGI